jgi:hypothetical protein
MEQYSAPCSFVAMAILELSSPPRADGTKDPTRLGTGTLATENHYLAAR